MMNLNLGFPRLVSNPHVMREGIRLARAEAFATNTFFAFPEQLALFALDEGYSFSIVLREKYNPKDYFAFQFDPEKLIGLGDGGLELYPDPKQIGPWISCFSMPKDMAFPVGKILYQQVTRTEVHVPDVDSAAIIRHFPHSRNGYLLPMLGLLAIKLESLHGIEYSVEAAADELYHLGFVREPDFSAKSDAPGGDHLPGVDMPSKIWTPTTPVLSEAWLRCKYTMPDMDTDQGMEADLFSVAMARNYSELLPVSFWRCALRPFPITLPCPQTSQTPLYNLYRICRAKNGTPVYLTEYPAVADKNVEGEHSVVSWFGGEINLRFANFSPLNGRRVVYLLLLADGEKDEKRAYRVMLKAFARAYHCGCRCFEALRWEGQETIPHDTLFAEAVAQGYLKIEAPQNESPEHVMARLLPWPDKVPGTPLFGRAYQSGRIHLVVAARGGGKTEMQLLLSVMGVHGVSIDNAFFKNHSDRPIRVLYIQREMNVETDLEKDRIKDAEYLLRRIAPEAMAATDDHEINFHTTDASLVYPEAQNQVLQKLVELDPQGESQWMLVIDSILTEMPEVLNGESSFRGEVYPWLAFMCSKGIAVSLLHHENSKHNISGPGSIQDLSEIIFHIVRAKKKLALGEDDVEIRVKDGEKTRLLKGNRQATAHWNWTTSEKDGIIGFHSEYLDADGQPETSSLQGEAQSTMPVDAKLTDTTGDSGTEEKSCNLPKNLKELQALEKEDRTIALFELWNRNGNQEGVAKALGCSKSSITAMMRECGVKADTLKEYLASKNSH